MREVRVNRCCNDFTTNFPELISSVTESDDLSGTHKGKVQGIEEKDNIFSCSNRETWLNNSLGENIRIVNQSYSLEVSVV